MDAEAYYNRGVAYGKTGEKTKAIEDLTQARSWIHEPDAIL